MVRTRDSSTVLQKYLEIVRRRWWFLVLGVSIALIAGTLVNGWMPPRYESTVRLIIGPAAANDQRDPYSAILTEQQLAKTYAELATARPVLETVVTRLGLDMDAGQLGRNVKVKLIPDTRLMDVTISSTQPELAAAIANAVAEQLAVVAASAAQPSAVLRQNVQADIDSLVERSRQARLELDQLGPAIERAQADGTPTDTLVRRRDVLVDNQSTWERTRATLYDTLLALRSDNPVLVVAPAAVPSESVTPSLGVMRAIAVPLGLAVAVLLAFVLELLDTTIRTPDRLPVDETLPFLGSVPRLGRPRSRADVLVGHCQPRSAAAESYRAASIALAGVAGSGKPHSLLITSSRSSEGKTTTAANLALVLAEAGGRVVLVDADLWRPRLHQLFATAPGPGLSDLLRPGGDLAQMSLMETGIERLLLLPAGPTVAIPAELISSTRTRQLFELLKLRADVVIVNGPPVLAASDAAMLASTVDWVVLIARAGLTTQTDLTRARDVLRMARANLAGLVLNGVEPRLSGQFGNYGQDHNWARVLVEIGQPVQPIPGQSVADLK